MACFFLSHKDPGLRRRGDHPVLIPASKKALFLGKAADNTADLDGVTDLETT